MIQDLRVGNPGYVGSGMVNGRSDRTGCQVVTLGHGAYHEAVREGKVNIFSNATAGVAPGTVLSTTPPFCIWNPPGSGFNISVLKLFMGYTSGTIGAGVVWICGIQTALPSGGTELTPQNALLGIPKQTVARGWTGATITQAVIVRPSFVLGAFLASTAMVPGVLLDWVDGELLIPPGSAMALQAVAAAGSTPLVSFGCAVEDIPIQ